MKKYWPYILGAVLVIAAAVIIALAIVHSKDQGGGSVAQSQANSVPAPNKACQILTLADAKQVLGASAKGGTSVSKNSSADVDVSVCAYTADAGNNAPVTGGKVASLIAQLAKTSPGAAANQREFGSGKPADAQPVSGYGAAAFWDPAYGQLNILKNNNWYILDNGPVTPADRTLDEAKQLANLLIGKM